MNNLPNLYIPGFPKSATTSISQALAQHPSIFAPLTVESHYWASDIPFYAAREGLSNRDAYESLYRRATGSHKWRLDGSTLYMYSEKATASIVQHVPEARFVVCIRAPEEIAVAWHMQMVNGNYESETDAEVAFNLSTKRRQGQQVPMNCPDHRLLDYERIASIGTQLGRLVDTAGADKIHLVTMGSVINNPVETLEGCWRFLDLPAEKEIRLGNNNSAFKVRCSWLRQSIYHPSVKPHITKLLNILPAHAGELTRSTFRKFVYQKADRKLPSETFRSFLYEFYSEERRKLRAAIEELYGAPRQDELLHKDLFG